MKRHLVLRLVLGLLPLASLTADPGQASALWGDPAAPTWDPATSRLPDFTHVGYMQGRADSRLAGGSERDGPRIRCGAG